MSPVSAVIEDKDMAISQHGRLVLAIQRTWSITPHNLVLKGIDNTDDVHMPQAEKQIPLFKTLIPVLPAESLVRPQLYWHAPSLAVHKVPAG